MEVLFRRADGSYIITRNGYPYQVLPDDPLFAAAESAGADAPLDPMTPLIPAPTLAERRDAARLDRGELCKALLDAGILSAASAVVAAKGDWPSEFDGFLAAMPESARPSAQIDWAAATTVRYGNPLLQSAALAYVQGNATAATTLLDSLFGVA